jgi:hypothetical protein
VTMRDIDAASNQIGDSEPTREASMGGIGATK